MVLILIVVEDGLVRLSVTIERYEDGDVLILIVVEDGLVLGATIGVTIERFWS